MACIPASASCGAKIACGTEKRRASRRRQRTWQAQGRNGGQSGLRTTGPKTTCTTLYIASPLAARRHPLPLSPTLMCTTFKFAPCPANPNGESSPQSPPTPEPHRWATSHFDHIQAGWYSYCRCGHWIGERCFPTCQHRLREQLRAQYSPAWWPEWHNRVQLAYDRWGQTRMPLGL